jgi:hypothetical protein
MSAKTLTPLAFCKSRVALIWALSLSDPLDWDPDEDGPDIEKDIDIDIPDNPDIDQETYPDMGPDGCMDPEPEPDGINPEGSNPDGNPEAPAS